MSAKLIRAGKLPPTALPHAYVGLLARVGPEMCFHVAGLVVGLAAGGVGHRNALAAWSACPASRWCLGYCESQRIDSSGYHALCCALGALQEGTTAYEICARIFVCELFLKLRLKWLAYALRLAE